MRQATETGHREHVRTVGGLFWFRAGENTTYLRLYLGTPAPVTVRGHRSHRMAASVNIAEPLVGVLVIVIALVLLRGIEIRSVNCLDMFSQGARVCVSFSAPRGFTNIRFLKL